MMRSSQNNNKVSYCVIIPTYNHSGTIEMVINTVAAITKDIIVVNDGSTDDTSEILKKFSDITIIEYPENQGKGYALKKGFRAAFEKGYDNAVTIDSDGQHRAEEIRLFTSEAAAHPGSLIVGSRNLVAENMPGKNSFANNFSNFWFRLQTGLPLPDTQSGFRLYPVKSIIGIRTISGRYEYELELLVRAAWKGIPVSVISVSVIYPPAEERITHFRPFADFIRISILNTFLTIIAILFVRPGKFLAGTIKKFSKD